jgi:hypothetical protein
VYKGEGLEAFDRDDLDFRLKKPMDIYKEICEYHYVLTYKMLTVLFREYQGQGSQGY